MRRILIAASATLALIGGGCHTSDTALPTSITGDYVLRVDSSAGGTPYWNDHAASNGDTFHASVDGSGNLTITGLRVAGYGAPGVLLRGVSENELRGSLASHGSLGPTLLDGYAVQDTVSVLKTRTGTIDSTATKAGSPTLSDRIGFTLLPRATVPVAGAIAYRTSTTAVLDSTADHVAFPVGSMSDLTLTTDGRALLDITGDNVDEAVYLTPTTATLLTGQSTTFDDTAPAGSNSNTALAVTLVAGVADTVVYDYHDDTGPTVNQVRYTDEAIPLSTLITAFPTANWKAFSDPAGAADTTDRLGTWPTRTGSEFDLAAFSTRLDQAVDGATGATAPLVAGTLATVPSTMLFGIDGNNDGVLSFASATADNVLPITRRRSDNHLIFAYRSALNAYTWGSLTDIWTHVFYDFTPVTAGSEYSGVLSLRAINRAGVDVTPSPVQVTFTIKKL